MKDRIEACNGHISSHSLPWGEKKRKPHTVSTFVDQDRTKTDFLENFLHEHQRTVGRHYLYLFTVEQPF